MGAEHLDQTCATATEDDSLCGGWLFVASWRLPTPCCDVVSLGEMPPQGFHFLPLEGRLQINDQRYGSKITNGCFPVPVRA